MRWMWTALCFLGLLLGMAGDPRAAYYETWSALAMSDQGGQVQFFGALRVNRSGMRKGKLDCFGSCLRPQAKIKLGLLYGSFAFRAKLGSGIVCTGSGVFDAVLSQGVSDYVCVQYGYSVVDAGTLLVSR